jgi:plasmid stability protein
MTITLEPETEARLCERAARDGKDVETLANALLADSLQDDEAAKKEAFHRALLASGLVTHITPPREPSKAERPRIVVQGEPVSETIIRERR